MEDTGAAERARKAGRSILSGSQRAGRMGATVARGTGRFVHRLSGASGASRTGFSHLLELTAAGGFGDAFVAIALAGSLFFSTSVEEARGRAAVALLVTIAPYAILAPLIGPLLDKVRQGNKFILMGTLLARGLLCWGMSTEGNDVLMLLPAAFGVLVLQKAYVVTRAAVTPRLLPSEITLVTANARSNLASLIATTTGAAVALGVDKVMGGGSQGAAWVLRVATVIYLVAMIPGLRLPDTVDAPAYAPPPDEHGNGIAPDRWGASAGQADQAGWPGGQGNGRSDRRTATHGTPFPGDPPGANVPGRAMPGDASRNATIPLRKAAGRRRPFFIPRVGPVVGEAMRANASMRAFYGFLLFFLVFILRGSTCKSTLVSAAHHVTAHHAVAACGQFGHVSDTVALGGFAAAAAVGGMLGTVIGSALRARWPQVMIFTVLALATAASIACAIFFSLASILIVTLAAAISQTLVKVAQDSILQREIPEEARSSAFAFSETVNQLALVGGGLVGLLWSLTGSGFAGLTFAAACLAIALVWLLGRRRRRIVHTRPTVAGSAAASTFRSPAGS
jgi:MFS family permease